MPDPKFRYRFLEALENLISYLNASKEETVTFLLKVLLHIIGKCYTVMPVEQPLPLGKVRFKQVRWTASIITKSNLNIELFQVGRKRKSGSLRCRMHRNGLFDFLLKSKRKVHCRKARMGRNLENTSGNWTKWEVWRECFALGDCFWCLDFCFRLSNKVREK